MLGLTYYAPLVIVAVSSAISQVQALNDWSVPCTSGNCEYNWNGDDKQAYASIALKGGQGVLSDITPAAGWKIMGCNSQWRDGPQKIRMVCAGTPEQMAHCGHVYENDVPENTLVRLPQNCGVGPFARIAETWEPEDQHVPIHIKRQLAASNVTTPARVRGLILDYDLSKIPESKGTVDFLLTTSNNQHELPAGKDIKARAEPLRGRAKANMRRGLGDFFKSAFNDVTDAGKAAITAVTDAGKDVATAVTDVAKDVATVVSQGASVVSSVATEAGDVLTEEHNITKSSGDIPVQVDKNFTMIDTTISCVTFKDDFEAHIKIDVDANVNATVNFGIVLAGKLVPPKLDEASIVSNLKGDASFLFHLELEAIGHFDTLFVSLFKIGLPGLDFPGLGAIGPIVNIGVRLQMDVDMAAQIDLNVDVHMDGVHMSFPEGSGDNSGQATPGNHTNALKLSTANAGLDAKGTITATLIPRLEFGIDTNIVSAFVFLDAELGGKIDMKLDTGVGALPSSDQTEETAAVNNGTVGSTGVDNSTIPENSSIVENGGNNQSTIAESPIAASNSSAESSVSNDVQEVTADETSQDPADIKDEDANALVKPTPKSKRFINLLRRSEIAASWTLFKRQNSTQDNLNGTTQGNFNETIIPDEDSTVADLVPESAAPNGCITVTSVFAVKAGAQGSVFPFLPKVVSFTIFETQKQLLQKCFGGATPDDPNAGSGEGTTGEEKDEIKGNATSVSTASQENQNDSEIPEQSQNVTNSSSAGKDDSGDLNSGSTQDDNSTIPEDNASLTRRLWLETRHKNYIERRQAPSTPGDFTPDFTQISNAIISALVCPNVLAKINALLPLLGI